MDTDVLAAMDELSKMKAKKRNAHSQPRMASDMSRFYGLEQVLALVPVGRTTIYNMVNAGEFPRQIKIGKRAAVWIKSEVDAWIGGKINRDDRT